MLRLAMRISKVDPTTAQSWAEKAAAGGTFTGIDDNARIYIQQQQWFQQCQYQCIDCCR